MNHSDPTPTLEVTHLRQRGNTCAESDIKDSLRGRRFKEVTPTPETEDKIQKVGNERKSDL